MIAILLLPVFIKGILEAKVCGRPHWGAYLGYIKNELNFRVWTKRRLYIFENVDKFKNYDINIKFTVEKLPQAKAEIDSLEQSQKDMLEADYKKIQEQGIEFVRVKPIQKEIFEIKTNELRSLFKYAAGRIIVVGVVFVKKTKKTPKEKIKLAKQRLKEV